MSQYTDLWRQSALIIHSKNTTVLLRESIKNISRKTIKEKYDAKIKADSAKKGRK